MCLFVVVFVCASVCFVLNRACVLRVFLCVVCADCVVVFAHVCVCVFGMFCVMMYGLLLVL